MITKTRCLKSMLASKELDFIMEAHNPISARIAQESGFKALWASGLTISASLGLSDRNEATWTQVLDIVELMADHTSIPILMDGDTGYGNFNTVRRLTRKMCSKDIAGLCIEDKVFPKLNSFLGENQQMASIEEFCGKIRAAKDSALDDNFCIVARIEAFICGKGIGEAIKRASAYHEAGADAVLIHSKKNNPSEIFEFTNEWAERCPVVIVPTKYFNTPTPLFREANISCVVWANHSLRASINAIKDITNEIRKKQSVASIESKIATLNDVFKLTNEFEVQEAEKLYLPSFDTV